MYLLRHVRMLLVPCVLGLAAAPGCGAKSSEDSPSASTTSDGPNPANAVPPTAGPGGVASSPGGSVPATPPKPAPEKPTAEQIAKWAIPQHEPLRLLACNDGFGDPAVQCLALTPDGKQYVLGGAKLTVWNTPDAQPAVEMLEKYESQDVERPIRAVAISADGKWLAAGDEKGTVLLWTLGDQKEAVVIPAHQGHISELAFSPDSKRLATTSYSGDVVLWQLPEGKKLKNLKMDQGEIRQLLFLSDNQLAAAGSEASIWNVETGEKEAALTTKHLINPALALSGDRKLLAFNDGDAAVRFWDIAKAQPADLTLPGAGAHLIACSPDGKRIATYSDNSEIHLWDAATGRVMQVIDAGWGQTSALAWLPGCDALLIASDGRVRIWGTPDAAPILGIQPIALPTPAAPAAGAHQPLTTAQLQSVIDIRAFPRLPGAVPKWSNGGMYSYAAPGSQREAEQFYRYVLEQAGWTEAPPSAASPGLVFSKDGCQLKVSFAPGGEGLGGKEGVEVTLQFEGNYDLRWLPKLAAIDSPSSYESFSLVAYRTKGEFTDVEAALLKQFHQAGWTAYTRLAASGSEDPNSRTLTMLQGGSELTVALGYPADAPQEVSVQTSIGVLSQSLPIPPDSGWIEFDASTALQLVINTKMDLKQTAEFYDRQMAAEGWLQRKAGRDFKDDKAWLPYIRGQQDVLLRLNALPGGGTRVVVGDAASSSWQLAKPVAANKDAAGIEAADYALPAGATAVKYDVDAKQIQFEVADTTPPQLGEQFIKQMEALKWKRDGAGIVDNDYTFITFKQERLEIQIRARSDGKKATAAISGDGLLWTKPLPTAPVRISYETWLRRNHKNATLDHLDEFVAEMHKIPARSQGK